MHCTAERKSDVNNFPENFVANILNNKKSLRSKSLKDIFVIEGTRNFQFFSFSHFDLHSVRWSKMEFTNF